MTSRMSGWIRSNFALYFVFVSFIILGIDSSKTYLRSQNMNLKASPGKDCSELIQDELYRISELGGGKVILPPGQFRIDRGLTVPTGVSLEGSWSAPHHGTLSHGTIIMVYAGRGNENLPAAVELSASSAVRNLTFCYPTQKLRQIEPFPWTIHGTGMHPTVENITLVNSYNGIAMEHHELHRINNVFGCVLRRGIFIDTATDIGRIENVHFNPHYWPRSGHDGVPADAQPNPDLAVALYMQNHLEAFVFGRTDWQVVLNTFVFGAKIGYRFIDNGQGSCNGNFVGIGADASCTCIQVDKTQWYGIQIVNGEFVNLPLRPEDENKRWVMIRTTKSFEENLQLTNCNFWGRTHQIVELNGSGTVTMIQGNARGWKHDPAEIPFLVKNGRFTLKDFNLKGPGPHISLQAGVVRAIIKDNFCDEGLEVVGEGAARAIVKDNE